MAYRKEVERLQHQLKEAEKVIDFYADAKNSDFDNQDYWEDTELITYYEGYDKNGNAFLTLDVNDKKRHGEEIELYEDYMVGKIARAYKSKYKERK